MIRSFKKIVSLTLVASFLLGLFPWLETPADALISETAETTVSVVNGLSATSTDTAGEWTILQDHIEGTTMASSATSYLVLRNTSNQKMVLSFVYEVHAVSTSDARIGQSTLVEDKKTMFVQELEANGYISVALEAYSTISLTKLLFTAPHTHPLGKTGDSSEVTFYPWSLEDSLPDTRNNYYLTCDVTLTDTTWTVPYGDVKLCLNGHKIEARHVSTVYSSVFTLDKWPNTSYVPTLSLCDCDGSHGVHEVRDLLTGSGVISVRGGLITGGTGTARTRSDYLINDETQINRDGLENDTAGGGIFLRAGSLYFYGGTVAGNTAQYGAGIYAECWNNYTAAGSVILDGKACVRGNATEAWTGNPADVGHSGGICFSANMTGAIRGNASVAGNKAAKYAGGIGVEDNASLTVSGGSITGNTAPVGGGLAIYGFRRASTVLIEGGSITGNTATLRGAGIAVESPVNPNEGAFQGEALKVSDTPCIAGNHLSDGVTASNLYLYENASYPNLNKLLTVAGALKSGARIGVTRVGDTTFTTGYGAKNGIPAPGSGIKDPAQFFSADGAGRVAILHSDNEVKLTAGVDYTIEHYLRDLTGTGYTLATGDGEPETRSAAVNAVVALESTDHPSYPGFTYEKTEYLPTSGNAGTVDNALTVRQYFTRNTHSVSYVYTGEPAGVTGKPANQTLKYGASVPLPTLSAAGYSFAWQVGGNTVTSYTMPDSDVTVTGVWSANPNTAYQVKHYRQNLQNNAYTLADTDDKTGTTGTATAAAAKDYPGFTAQAVIQKAIAGAGNTVVEIRYDRNTHNVSYAYAGTVPDGAPAASNGKTGVKYGATVAVAAAPTRTGYTFSGWNAGGVSVSNGSFTMPDADVAFTGTWSPVDYTITYNGMEGASLPAGKTNPATYTINSPDITLNNPTKTGYEFKGWSGTGLNGNDNQSVTIPAGSTGNRSYTANWTLNGYPISYDLDGGTVATANPDAYAVDTPDFTLTNPTRAGYTFTGWTGTGLSSATATVTVPAGSTGNRTYKANWTANTNTAYQVEYYQQNANNDNYTPVAGDTVNGAGTTDTTATATEKNYTHFHYNAAKSTASGNIAGDGSLVLKLYYDRDTYQVSYGYTGTVPDGAPTAPATKSWRYGAAVAQELPPMMDSYVLFSGWSTSNVTVTSGSFTMPAGNVSFTGSWMQGYSVRFHKADHTTVIENREATLGTPVNVTAPTLSAGYNFWYSAAYPNDTVGSAAAINGILQSREYTEYKYFVTLKNGETTTKTPSDGSVTMPGLDAGKVWRSNSGSFAEGGATVTVTGDTTFEVVDKINISSAAVGVTDPAYGAAPVTTAAVSGEADFSAGPVVWKKQDGTILTGAQTFDAGVPYTATVTLTPKAGYQFASGTQITLNGRSVPATVNADGTRTVSLTFTVPVIERTAWVWGSGYGSAGVTVLYSTDTASNPDRETLTAAVTGPETDGDTTTCRADATATKYGPQTVKTELSVTRSGERVTGVTVKTWINNTLKASTALTVSGGVITEKGDGSFTVTGSGTLTTLETGSQTLYGDSSGTLTADGLYQGSRGTAPGDNDNNGSSSDNDSSGGSDNSGSAGNGGNGAGSSGSSVVAGAPYTGPSGGTPFSGLAFGDVLPGDWCYDAVAYVFDSGWMTGVTETEFAPSDASTRAAVVEVLYRMAGSPAFAEESTYSDVLPDRFYADAVAWAQANGITLGVTSNLFRPEEAVTREQFVTFLYRYALYRSMNAEGRDDLSRYTDWETVSSYAENPMQWASDAGIIVGRSILLAPHEPATRAEIATMLARFCTIYGLDAVSGPIQP